MRFKASENGLLLTSSNFSKGIVAVHPCHKRIKFRLRAAC